MDNTNLQNAPTPLVENTSRASRKRTYILATVFFTLLIILIAVLVFTNPTTNTTNTPVNSSTDDNNTENVNPDNFEVRSEYGIPADLTMYFDKFNYSASPTGLWEVSLPTESVWDKSEVESTDGRIAGQFNDIDVMRFNLSFYQPTFDQGRSPTSIEDFLEKYREDLSTAWGSRVGIIYSGEEFIRGVNGTDLAIMSLEVDRDQLDQYEQMTVGLASYLLIFDTQTNINPRIVQIRSSNFYDESVDIIETQNNILKYFIDKINLRYPMESNVIQTGLEVDPSIQSFLESVGTEKVSMDNWEVEVPKNPYWTTGSESAHGSFTASLNASGALMFDMEFFYPVFDESGIPTATFEYVQKIMNTLPPEVRQDYDVQETKFDVEGHEITVLSPTFNDDEMISYRSSPFGGASYLLILDTIGQRNPRLVTIKNLRFGDVLDFGDLTMAQAQHEILTFFAGKITLNYPK